MIVDGKERMQFGEDLVEFSLVWHGRSREARINGKVQARSAGAYVVLVSPRS